MQEELPAEKAVRNILEKCVIRLDGEAISKEAISQSFLSFLSEVSAQHEHNIGIVLHTGSIIFDALAVLWAAISSMLAKPALKIWFARCGQARIWSNMQITGVVALKEFLKKKEYRKLV